MCCVDVLCGVLRRRGEDRSVGCGKKSGGDTVGEGRDLTLDYLKAEEDRWGVISWRLNGQRPYTERYRRNKVYVGKGKGSLEGVNCLEQKRSISQRALK